MRQGPQRVEAPEAGSAVRRPTPVGVVIGFTRVEQTLLDEGHGDDVIRQRMVFQDVMRERFEEVVERATGRKVVGFMSGNQQDPDMICEVFVLEANDVAH